MTDLKEYMLYTKEQADLFEQNHAAIVRARLKVYASWISNLPLGEWIPFLEQVARKDYEVVIGLICLCYRKGLVNITFSRDYWKIRRDPG